MAAMGAILTHYKLLDAQAMKGISAVVKDVAVPCLLFYRVGSAISLDNIVKWAPVPVYAISNTLFGCALGYTVARLSCLEPSVCRFVMTSVGFTNTNTIALAFMQVLPFLEPDRLRLNKDDVLETPSAISTRGIAYVLLYNMSVTFLRWTLADRMLESKKSDTNYRKKKEDDLIVGEGARELDNLSAAKDFPKITKSQKCKHVLKKILSFLPLPLWICFIAVGIGLSPLKQYFFSVPGATSAPPLLFFSEAINYVGQIVAPMMNFVLGSKLIKGPPKGAVNTVLLALIAWLKLVVVPLLFGVGLVYFVGWKITAWIHDPTMLFVLLLESANPPALLLLLMCTSNNFMVEEITALIFYSYMFSIVTLTSFCFLFLLLL